MLSLSRIFHASRCYNGGKKHRYVEVLDKQHESVTTTSIGCYTFTDKSTYVKHVCTWCGHEIKR